MFKYFFLLSILLFSNIAISNPVQDEARIVKVEDCEFVFKKSSFEGLEDSILYDKIFGCSLNSQIYRRILDLTETEGVHLDTFEGIHFAIEKVDSEPESGKKILPKSLNSIRPWKIPREILDKKEKEGKRLYGLPELPTMILSEIMSYVPRDLKKMYSEDLKDLGLQGKLQLPYIWSRTYEEADFKYYVINLAGIDFEFVGVPNGDEVDYMMSTAVTQDHWKAVTGENPAHFAGRGLDLPVENVSYNDIVNNFLPRLNKLLKKAGFEGGFRLPSDLEWQRMADKNVASDFSYNKSRYSDFGKDRSSEQPSPVNSKAPGLLGAWMFGGVGEWVGIPHASSGHITIRGGGWNYLSVLVGPSARCSRKPDFRERSFGFRLLRTLPLRLSPFYSESQAGVEAPDRRSS